MIENISIAVLSLSGGYFLGIYRNRRSRLLTFRKFIARLLATLEDSDDKDLISFFLSNKDALRDISAITEMDVLFWKRQKFTKIYHQFINLQEKDLIDDGVRQALLDRKSISEAAPYTPNARFPGRDRMENLLKSLLKIAS